MPNMNSGKSIAKRGTNVSIKQQSTSDIGQFNESGTNMKGKRCKRSQKRAWKWRVPKEEPIKEDCAKCQYVSRRIGIACDNVRKRSELSSVGICEQHMRFARQLKQLFIAEQCLSDQGDFTGPRMDEDGITSISDDDETLPTMLDWPWSEENLIYDPSSTDDHLNVIANAEAISEKELLKWRLSALEGKLAAIKEYREVLAERQLRYEAYLKKKIVEEAKKGQLVAQTRKEKRQMQLLRACKRYGRWRNSKTSKAMRQKLLARLKMKADQTMERSESDLEYLDVNVLNEEQEPSTCSYVYEEDGTGDEEVLGDENTKETEDGQCGKANRRQCTNWALPHLNYCIRHVFENVDQQMFAACLECGAAALDLDDGDHYCFDHFSKKNVAREHLYGPLEIKTSSDFSSTSTPPSSMRTSFDSATNLVMHSAPPTELSEQVSTENLLSDKEENSMDALEPHSEIILSELNELSLKLDNLELKGSGAEVRYEDEDPDAPPIKLVLIDSENEECDEGSTQQSKLEECSSDNTAQRMPALAFDLTSGVHSLSLVAPRRVAVSPRKKLDDRSSTQSTARTRPFHPNFFGDSNTRTRRQCSISNAVISPQRYITIEQRTHLDEGTVGSHTAIQKLRMAGPYPPHSEMQIHSPRKATPANPNFMQPNPVTTTTPARSLSGPTAYHASASVSRLTDPSTISLGATANMQRPQSPPHTKRSAIVQRTNLPPLLRNRQMLTQQLLHQSTASSSAERSSYCVPGSSSIGQRWRTQQTTSPLPATTSRMPNSYRGYSAIDISDRALGQRTVYGDYRRERDERMFTVSGNARSRLVPVDPSPSICYSQPRYRSYIVPRSIRNFPREHSAPVRRLSLPRDTERDCQQLVETAAAVASIASISDPQPRNVGEEHRADTNVNHLNAIDSQQLKREDRETEPPSRSITMPIENEPSTQTPPHTPNHPIQLHSDEHATGQRIHVPCAPEEVVTLREENSSNVKTLSSQECATENTQDGLALLADTAASQAAAIHRNQVVLTLGQVSEGVHISLSSTPSLSHPTIHSVAPSSSAAEPQLSDRPLDFLNAKQPQIFSFGLEPEDEGSD